MEWCFGGTLMTLQLSMLCVVVYIFMLNDEASLSFFFCFFFNACMYHIRMTGTSVYITVINVSFSLTVCSLVCYFFFPHCFEFHVAFTHWPLRDATNVKLVISNSYQDLTGDNSTLVQVMSWCRLATSHYLSQCWPWSMLPYGITNPLWGKHPVLNINGLPF